MMLVVSVGSDLGFYRNTGVSSKNQLIVLEIKNIGVHLVGS